MMDYIGFLSWWVCCFIVCHVRIWLLFRLLTIVQTMSVVVVWQRKAYIWSVRLTLYVFGLFATLVLMRGTDGCSAYDKKQLIPHWCCYVLFWFQLHYFFIGKGPLLPYPWNYTIPGTDCKVSCIIVNLQMIKFLKECVDVPSSCPVQQNTDIHTKLLSTMQKQKEEGKVTSVSSGSGEKLGKCAAWDSEEEVADAVDE